LSPQADPVGSHNVDIVLDQLHCRGQRHCQGRRLDKSSQHQVPDLGGRGPHALQLGICLPKLRLKPPDSLLQMVGQSDQARGWLKDQVPVQFCFRRRSSTVFLTGGPTMSLNGGRVTRSRDRGDRVTSLSSSSSYEDLDSVGVSSTRSFVTRGQQSGLSFFLSASASSCCEHSLLPASLRPWAC
jgi:hypothetical protein